MGNPGGQYLRTRHNLGFWVLDLLSKQLESFWGKTSGKSRISQTVYGEWSLVLAKPTTYMNRAGEAVSQLLQKFSCAPRDLLIICDDVNLPLAKLRIRKEGSAGGHHGLESVLQAIETSKFPRIRIGVKPLDVELPRDLNRFVLEKFSGGEEALISEAVKQCVQVVFSILDDGFEAAMNYWNRPRHTLDSPHSK